jgi:hypothetical protein
MVVMALRLAERIFSKTKSFYTVLGKEQQMDRGIVSAEVVFFVISRASE